MKEFYFSLVLMLSGAIIIAGGIIAFGMIVGGTAAGTGYPTYGEQAESTMIFVTAGAIIFVIGLVISLTNIFSKKKQVS
jgi:hypothetical protein